MTELPNADHTFPPVAQPIELELRRIEAAALLMEPQCARCDPTTEVVAASGDLPKALGFTHEDDCPNRIE